MQDADVLEIAVSLGVVEAVTDNELIMLTMTVPGFCGPLKSTISRGVGLAIGSSSLTSAREAGRVLAPPAASAAEVATSPANTKVASGEMWRISVLIVRALHNLSPRRPRNAPDGVSDRRGWRRLFS